MPAASSLHSPDSRWWWNGEQWLPAYSEDGRRWFDGTAWIHPFPEWRRWTWPTGLVMLIGGLVGSSVGGIMVVGDPGPDHVKHVPHWIFYAGFATNGLILVGVGLLLASPIQQVRERRSRRQLATAESGHPITKAN